MTSEPPHTALLVLDVQAGLADQPFAAAAVEQIQQAIVMARSAAVPVMYSRVGFRPGYRDVAPWSRAFSGYATDDRLPPNASRLIPALQPHATEPVLQKARFSPFAGTDLSILLRSQSIDHVVLTGLTTAGVVLSAFTHAENHDLEVTVLQDACADQDSALHTALIRMFHRSATVLDTTDWQPR